MDRRFLAYGLLVTTLMCSLGTSSVKATEPTYVDRPHSSNAPLIQLRTFPSCKNCEVYELSIERSGSVTYVGKSLVKVQGPVRFEIDETVVGELLRAFDDMDFMSLPEGMLLGGVGVDIPVTEIALVRQGKTKTVRFKMGNNRETEKLTALARKIQQSVGIRKLICPAEIRSYGCR